MTSVEFVKHIKLGGWVEKPTLIGKDFDVFVKDEEEGERLLVVVNNKAYLFKNTGDVPTYFDLNWYDVKVDTFGVSMMLPNGGKSDAEG